MNKTWKRIVSVIMALAMVVLCLPGYANPVKTAKANQGDPAISYIDASGEEKALEGKDYTRIYEDTVSWYGSSNMPTTLHSGIYVVDSSQAGHGYWTTVYEVQYNSSVTIDGDVTLILPNDSRLSIPGIIVPEGSKLTICGQAPAEGQEPGRLVSNASSRNNQAGIGGTQGNAFGEIVIAGGSISATGGRNAAGIGGGNQSKAGSILICGGQITNALGGSRNGRGGAGIGSGREATGNVSITITGGTVSNAKGGNGAAGIGGGSYSSGGIISISGGDITATGGTGSNGGSTYSGAGIGGGSNAGGGTIVISGGTVNATGTLGASGIGDGRQGNGGKVSISITDNNTSVTANSYGGTVTLVTPVKDVTSSPNVDLDAGVVTNHSKINGRKLVKATTYTIQFVNADSEHTPLQDPIEVTPGTHPKYSGATPTLPTTAQYTYTFSGWKDENNQTYGKDEELPAASGSMTYTATYTTKVNEYTVTFVKEDGSEISSETYPYNTAADNIAVPTAPEKNPSTEETFEFKGWLNTTTNAIGVVAVTGDVTYKATYTGSPRKYTVTFVDENGVNIIDPVEYEYNTAANTITVPEAPAKGPSTEETFEFAGWQNTTTNAIGVAAVTGDVTYMATYAGSPRKYTVTFKDADGNNIIDPAQYDYNTPADDIVVPEAPFKDADANYVYTFSGWSPDITAVTGDATYVATYSTSPRQYSDFEVKVVWDDNGNCDGFRPDSVTVTLLGNEETVSTQDLSGDAWTYTFHVPTNDVKGHPITYTIDANSVDSYEKTVNSFTVTYKHTPETTEASVKVVWVDSNDAFSTRPNDLEVYLSDGEVVTLTANSWAATLSDLLKRQDGQIINYTWSEFSVPGYELTNTTTEGTTTTFTFTLITTTVSGEVLWELKDNSVDLLPENVTVYIKEGNTTIDTITVSANTAGEWTFTSIDLPKYRTSGTGTVEIPYTVSEAAVPRFATTISGTEITNTLNTCDVTVFISWDDADNQDEYRPNEDGVAVTLIGDSVEVDTIVLNAENDWTHTWTDVPKESDSDTDIQYTVEGAAVSEYDLTLDDDKPYLKVLNYQHTPETTEVNIEVVWNDKDNQDGYRPDAITVNLLANNEIVESAELLAFDQSNSWLNLPKKANGENIDYTVTVEEDNLSKYTVAIDEVEGDDFKYTVALNHEIEKTNVKVTVAWDDADDQDGYRPDYVTIRLLADSVEKDEVTLNEDNNWTYTWSDLDKKAGGVAIDYTVKEDGVENYNAQITKATDGTFTYTVTNTHKPEETEVKVSKVWSDADDQDGYRPDLVTINLLADDEVIKTVQLNEENNWSYNWTKLPKKADGSDIDYTVTEDEVAEYSTNIVKAEDGTFTYTVTNTHETEETEVSVIKVWEDADDQDGYRPDEVTVNLLADGKIIDTVTLSEENEWSYSWTKLDKKANGAEIDYTVTENAVAEYTASIVKADANAFSYTITNTHETETVDVTISKVWDDNGNIEGFRVGEVTVHVMNGTKTVDTAVLGENNSWTYTFANLPKKANGVDIVYTATEDSVANYSTNITNADGTFTYTVTNSRTVEYTQVSVEKIWDDSDNKEGFRPDAVTVKLLANGAEAGTATLNEDNEWKYTWDDLQKYVNGQEVTFTVSEDQLANYKEPVIEKVSETAWAYTVTNSRDLEETEVNVTKVWDDSDNSEGFRPASVNINLMKGSEKIDSVVLDQDNNWTYTWTKLQKYENGVAINYTVTEDSVDNYSTRITKATDGTFTYTVTNSRTVEKTEVSVEKIWDDSDDIEGFRPDGVTIKLLANGEEAGTAALDYNNDWKYTWTDLQKFENGEEIEYTVSEDQIERYKAPVIEKVSETAWSYTVTNSRTVEKTSVSVEKIWDDTDNAEGFRPASVTIKLFANGEEAGSVMLDADNNWKYILTDLQKFAEGKEIVYTVSEDQLANYKTPVIEKVSETEWSYTVTNSRDLEVTEATVKTVWVDADDQDGYRPESLTVKLLANGGETNKSVTLNEENGWEAKLTGLQKYADHEEIEYTWVEEGLSEKYSLTNSETVETITTLTNSHTPEETEATVKVIWNLDAKEIKNPPEALTVALSDGQNLSLNADSNWTGTIENLPKFQNHGDEIDYTWTADNLPDGYELTDTSVDGTETTLTITYSVESVSQKIKVEKIMVGSWGQADSFEFTLGADADNTDGATLPENVTAFATKADPIPEFGEIVFSKYGTYKFYVTETDDGVPGITYDTDLKEITVVIKDNGAGALVVDSVTNDGKVSVTNEYHSSGSFTFTAKKVLVGQNLEDQAFLFKLELPDGSYLWGYNDADGNITFSAINFTEADMVDNGQFVKTKTYQYIISEVPSDNIFSRHIIHDLTTWTLTLQLTDNLDGTISAEIIDGNPGTDVVFTNTVVSVLKVDANGNALEGAHLRVLDSAGNVLDEWDTADVAHQVKNLVAEAEYTLEETFVPSGYAFAPIATFTVNADGSCTVDGLTVNEDGILLLENKLAKEPEMNLKTQDINDTTGETSDWQDSADYDIGDEVPFKLTAKLADNVTDYRAYSITFHDAMEGLTFKSIDKVTVNNDELSSDDYSITVDTDSFDLTILWSNSDGRITDDALNEATVEVFFTGVLNEDAVLGADGNANICSLEYSCNPNVDEDGNPSEETNETELLSVIVFTYGIELTVSGESVVEIDEAEFELLKVSGNEELHVATVGIADGMISFTGIDDGKYTLKQTKVPAHTVQINPISFTVSAGHLVAWEKADDDILLTSLSGEVTEGDLTLTADVSEGILSGEITLETASYKITFCDEKGNEISSKEYKYGTKAEDIDVPTAPEKQSDDEKNYVFSAWVNTTTDESGVKDVTGEATYKATYADSSRKYVITFVNEDGTELQKSEVEYGKTPAYNGTTPTKAADDKYTYEFESWTPAIADVTADATYTATYKATEIKKDPVKGVYKYIGDAAKYTKGSKQAVTLIIKRTENDEITIEMFDGVKTAAGALTAGKHFTYKKGSVEITLLPEYLETLEVGKTSFTVSFKDGDPVTIELEVAPAQQQADTNPTTGDSMNMNYIWIICIIGAAALAIVLFVQIRRRREEEF